jgi:RNA polymerase sigma factor (sigma-70 family)
MSAWPATRVTLLDRIHDTQDQEAWAEFVGLYGPLVFTFARRRLPQDDDAADVMQEVLSAIVRGTYQRTTVRFQKWLVTVILNQIRDFHTARVRRSEVSGDLPVIERLEVDPSRIEEEEWEQDRQRQMFRIAADRVRVRTNPAHWEAFVRTALENQSGQAVASAVSMSLTNVYAIKSRLMKEIKDEIQRLGED